MTQIVLALPCFNSILPLFCWHSGRKTLFFFLFLMTTNPKPIRTELCHLYCFWTNQKRTTTSGPSTRELIGLIFFPYLILSSTCHREGWGRGTRERPGYSWDPGFDGKTVRVSFWENPKFLDRNGTECGIEKENGILDSHGKGVGMQVQDPPSRHCLNNFVLLKCKANKTNWK